MLGADRVIAIDRVPERLEMAREYGDAEMIDVSKDEVYDRLMSMTGGRGPDSCIDAVGSEAHGTGLVGFIDKAKQQAKLQADRPTVLRQAIKCCRKGGTLSIPGVYVGHVDNFPAGPIMNKALTVNTGQTHVQRYLDPLLERIEDGEIDPSVVVTHREDLEKGPELYRKFREKQDGCIKAVLTP
jgi:threonine dehydrogenase-like Zn-dependent dehydrogenase